MAIRLQLLFVCLAATALGQDTPATICNCPLVGTLTSKVTPSCPTGNVLAITSTSTVGACRNPRTTTTTTTRTAGICNCPTQATLFETAPPDCPDVTSTSTIIERTIDCPWAATATQTITQYGPSNGTSFPTTIGGSGSAPPPTGTIPTGAAPSTPTCSLSKLPETFYIYSSHPRAYLLYDLSTQRAVSCPHKADATPFHVNMTDVFDIDGVPQLSLYWPAASPSESKEYGAYVQYDGGPVRFFQAGQVPEEDEDGGGGWFEVTAGFSTFLCELSLVTWNLHDLSTAQDCAGALALGYGFGGDQCPDTRLTVEPA